MEVLTMGGLFEYTVKNELRQVYFEINDMFDFRCGTPGDLRNREKHRLSPWMVLNKESRKVSVSERFDISNRQLEYMRKSPEYKQAAVNYITLHNGIVNDQTLNILGVR